MKNPPIRLAPRLYRQLPSPEFIKRLADWDFDHSVYYTDEPIRDTREVMYLGGYGATAVLAAICGHTGRTDEMFLARWRKLKGHWKMCRSIALRLDMYGVALHDACCHYLKTQGVDPCRGDLPSMPGAPWIKVCADGSGEV